MSGGSPVGPLGVWCSVPNAYVVEILCRAGFDWLCVDMQHGFAVTSDLLPMMQAAAITATPVLVRVPDSVGPTISRALDAGARGVIVPNVDTADHARRALSTCRYPPHGRRSWGPARLNMIAPTYALEAPEAQPLCVVMIESEEAVGNLDEILAVSGIDVILVGPSDLAIDLGFAPSPIPIPGPHEDALAGIASHCLDLGVMPAIYAGTREAVIAYRAMGYQAFGVTNDAALLGAAAKSAIADLRDQA